MNFPFAGFFPQYWNFHRIDIANWVITDIIIIISVGHDMSMTQTMDTQIDGIFMYTVANN